MKIETPELTFDTSELEMIDRISIDPYVVIVTLDRGQYELRGTAAQIVWSNVTEHAQTIAEATPAQVKRAMKKGTK